MYYTTEGSVRGCCGHKHRTLSGAVRCLESDSAGCKSQGGYSDRNIYEIDETGTHLLVQTGYGRFEYERLPDDE